MWEELQLIVTAHDPDYRAALQDFTTFLEQLSEKITEMDDTIPELPVKDIVRALNLTMGPRC